MYSYLCQFLAFREFTSNAGKHCSVVTLLFRHKYRNGDKWEVYDFFVSDEVVEECRSFPPGMMCRVESMAGNGRIVRISYDDEHETIFE